jgi:hypothetical protein
LGLADNLDSQTTVQQGVWNVARQVSTIDAQNPPRLFDVIARPSGGNPRWNRQTGAWFRALLALVELIVAAISVAFAVLRRFDPV